MCPSVLTPDPEGDLLLRLRGRVDDARVRALVRLADVLDVQVPLLDVGAVDADAVVVRHRLLVDGEDGRVRVAPDHLQHAPSSSHAQLTTRNSAAE